MKVFGNLRKRWVLGAIFFTSVFYFIYNTGTQLSSKQLTNEVSLLEVSFIDFFVLIWIAFVKLL